MPKLSAFPNGISSLGIPTFGAGGLLPFTGNYWWAQENGVAGAGVSAGAGTAGNPFNSLQQAVNAASDGNNDVIFLSGTLHQTATVNWNKNNLHLVGLCSPLKRGKRARISPFGGTPAYGPLVNVTGNGCMFMNFGTFFGFPITGATSPICWQDTGGHNSYNGVEFLGFGDGTVTTGTANQTGARAFKFNSSVGETTFRDCVFGVDTIQRGAANYTVEIAGGAPRITFERCDFESDLAAGGTASSHLLIGAAGIDRYLILNGCHFLSATKSSGSAMAQAFNVNAAAGGVVLMDQCEAFGITAWETAPSGSVFTNMSAVSAPGGGISLVL